MGKHDQESDQKIKKKKERKHALDQESKNQEKTITNRQMTDIVSG